MLKQQPIQVLLTNDLSEITEDDTNEMVEEVNKDSDRVSKEE